MQLGESVKKKYHARSITVRNGVKNGDNLSCFVFKYLRRNEVLDETEFRKEFVVRTFSGESLEFFCSGT